MRRSSQWPASGVSDPDEAETEDEEIGAVVVAVTPEICDEALKLIKVEWEVLPSLVDAPGWLKTRRTDRSHRPKGPGIETFTTGDVEAGFKEADHIVEFDWAQSRTASHIPNPNGSVAWWAQDPWGVEGPTLYIEGICSYVGRISAAPHVQSHLRQAPSRHPFQGGKYCDWIIRRSQLITPLLARRTGTARPMRKRPGKTITILQIRSDIRTQKSDSKRMERLRRSRRAPSGIRELQAKCTAFAMGGIRSQIQSFQYNPMRQSEEPFPGSIYQFGPQYP